jgi:hypothetical protein
VRLRLLLLAIVVAVVGFAIPAHATHCGATLFCAFNGASYGHAQLLASGVEPPANNVDVADDLTSSAKNRSDDRWCAVNNGFPGDDTIFSFAPNTNYAVLGGANNLTDHFYVRTGTQQCT